MEIKLITEEGKNCKGIEMQNCKFYFRTPISISKINSDLKVLQRFGEIVDLSLVSTNEPTSKEIGEWDQESLERFLASRPKHGKAFFEILSKSDDWIFTSALKEELTKMGFKNIISQSVSGIRSGNTRALRHYHKEQIDEQEWISEEWENRYRIKPKYQEMVKKFFERQK